MPWPPQGHGREASRTNRRPKRGLQNPQAHRPKDGQFGLYQIFQSLTYGTPALRPKAFLGLRCLIVVHAPLRKARAIARYFEAPAVRAWDVLVCVFLFSGLEVFRF